MDTFRAKLINGGDAVSLTMDTAVGAYTCIASLPRRVTPDEFARGGVIGIAAADDRLRAMTVAGHA